MKNRPWLLHHSGKTRPKLGEQGGVLTGAGGGRYTARTSPPWSEGTFGGQSGYPGREGEAAAHVPLGRSRCRVDEVHAAVTLHNPLPLCIFILSHRVCFIYPVRLVQLSPFGITYLKGPIASTTPPSPLRAVSSGRTGCFFPVLVIMLSADGWGARHLRKCNLGRTFFVSCILARKEVTVTSKGHLCLVQQ